MKRAWPEGKDLHFHDLRGTAATNFARAGLTATEIARILAWSPARVERILARYVHGAAVLREIARRVERVQNEKL